MSKKIVESVEKTLENVINDTNKIVEPVRRTVFHRFPVLFALLVTFGIVMTFLGFEKLLESIAFLNNNPLLMLVIGISTLAVTGTLYKKLG